VLFKHALQVEFHTSFERGAGTDANISFQLFGEKGEGEMQRVVASKEAFERGKVDTFVFKGWVVDAARGWVSWVP